MQDVASGITDVERALHVTKRRQGDRPGHGCARGRAGVGMTEFSAVPAYNPYYRIQVKSIHTCNESVQVDNKWQGANIDYVVYFSIPREWGYIAPAFREPRKRLDAPGHIRFHKHPTSFLKAFGKI